jgi:hypothetical protein
MRNLLSNSQHLTSAEMQVQRAFKRIEIRRQLTEYEQIQVAIEENLRKLRAERLARDSGKAQPSPPKGAIAEAGSRRWTKEDVRQLRLLANGNNDVGRLAMLLDRTPGAVTMKASKLGISLNTRF